MKKIRAKLKLEIPGGQATPAPPVGSTLAPYGINIQEFCKRFNDATKNQIGLLIPVKVYIFEDKSYEIKIKRPSTAEFLKRLLNVEKLSGEPNKKKVGKIKREELKKIAREKLPDLTTKDLEKAVKILEGTAKQVGIEIED